MKQLHTPTRRVNVPVRLPVELRDELTQAAQSQHVSRDSLTYRIISEWLFENGPDAVNIDAACTRFSKREERQ